MRGSEAARALLNDDAHAQHARLFESSLKSLQFLHRGKVRDLYAVGDDKLLVIQSDRLSAFDVVLPDPMPGKGEVLTALSFFWFEKLGHVIPNHLTGIDAGIGRGRGRARPGRGSRDGRATS